MLHLAIIGDSPAVCKRMSQFPSSARYWCAGAVRERRVGGAVGEVFKLLLLWPQNKTVPF